MNTHKKEIALINKKIIPLLEDYEISVSTIDDSLTVDTGDKPLPYYKKNLKAAVADFDDKDYTIEYSQNDNVPSLILTKILDGTKTVLTFLVDDDNMTVSFEEAKKTTAKSDSVKKRNPVAEDVEEEVKPKRSPVVEVVNVKPKRNQVVEDVSDVVAKPILSRLRAELKKKGVGLEIRPDKATQLYALTFHDDGTDIIRKRNALVSIIKSVSSVAGLASTPTQLIFQDANFLYVFNVKITKGVMTATLGIQDSKAVAIVDTKALELNVLKESTNALIKQLQAFAKTL